MKKILFIAFVLLIGMTGCKDDDLVSGGVVSNQPGEEIQFGAVQSPLEINDLDNPSGNISSRTHYGFLYDNDGTSYPIYWDNGDVIAIYSPEAEVPNPSNEYSKNEMDYKITVSGADDTNAGTLTKIEANGLQWTDEEEYNFYAFYPSDAKKAARGQDGRAWVELNLPTSQSPKEIVYEEDLVLPPLKEGGSTRGGYKGYVARPNMDYMYMYAHTLYNKNTGEYKTQTGKSGSSKSSVYLDFKPIVTTAEFIIHGPGTGESFQVSQVVIRSSQAICGDFNMYIDNLGGTVDGHTEAQPNGTVTNQVTIPTRINNEPITLKDDEILIVRAFLLPYQTIIPGENVQTAVTVHMPGNGTKTKILESTKGIQKHKINIAELPKLEKGYGNYWQTQLDENVYFSQLSMPGSHNAYCINTSTTDPPAGSNLMITEQFQTLSINDQLKAGARAFSFTTGFSYNNYGTIDTDWNNDYDVYVFPGTSTPVQENGKDLTLEQALKNYIKEIYNLNANYKKTFGVLAPDPHEFIVLNITWSQWGERQLEARRWLKEVDRIIDNISGTFTGDDGVNVSYADCITNEITAETTIKDLARKVVVFVNYQGDALPKNTDNIGGTRTRFGYTPSDDADKYVFLWQTFGENGADITTTGVWSAADAGVNGTDDIKRAGFVNMDDRDYYFIFKQPCTGNGVGGNINIWRQNLERMGNPDIINFTNQAHGSTAQYFRGLEDTKCTMVGSLFEKALANNSATTGGEGDWYMNNLGGFCIVDEGSSLQWDWGCGGNPVLEASIVNKYAYEYLMKNGDAPCGIVLLNYYGTENLKNEGISKRVYGQSLQNLLVENNYRFALRKKDTTTSGTETTAASYNSSMAKGGTGFGLSWSY